MRSKEDIVKYYTLLLSEYEDAQEAEENASVLGTKEGCHCWAMIVKAKIEALEYVLDNGEE